MNKSALKTMALEVRVEIGLTAYDVLDPYKIAELYGVDIVKVGDLDCSADSRRHLQVIKGDVFSGALVPVGTGSVLLENDAHPRERRRATASHELSHLILEHPFNPTFVNDKGCRTALPELEREAAELSAELLLPFEAAKQMARQRLSDKDAAFRYDVSIELARWRLNGTGARKIAARLQQRSRSI